VGYRKSYALYRVVTLLVTLGDPWTLCNNDDLECPWRSFPYWAGGKMRICGF